MEAHLRLEDLATNPARVARAFTTRTGAHGTLRPLARSDAAALGRYFLDLSEDTKRRYGPHPFDQQTADAFCATLEPERVLRMIAVLADTTPERIIAYIILRLRLNADECARYAPYGIILNPEHDCTVAPSVADDFQNQGLGSILFTQVIGLLRQLGRRYLLLQGGVFITNAGAVRFYQKVGFHIVGEFEHPTGIRSYDMFLDLTTLAPVSREARDSAATSQ